MTPKLFLFVRHAIAVPAEDFAGPDIDRPLTPEGIRKARKIMARLVRVHRPTRVLASPYKRAVETAELLLDALGKGAPEIERTGALAPDAEFDAWKKHLETLQPELTADDVVAVFGHEPSIGEFFARHLGMRRALPFKKAGVGIVRPDGYTAGELVAYVPPKVWLA